MFKAGDRGGVFTYHYGKGRGVRFCDEPRSLLWLCGFDEAHAGYEYCEHLQSQGVLYPDVDPAWQEAQNTLVPWGERLDEDIYEWARMIYGALCTWEINRPGLDAGRTISYPSSTHLELSKDDEIWTLVMRRNLAYLPPSSRRARWLPNGEMQALFDHIAGHLDGDQYEWENPPHPQQALFAQAHFIGEGPVAPDEWLRRVSSDATEGKPPALVL